MRRKRTWFAMVALCLTSGCSACDVEEQTGPAVLANQDDCVPIEERDECFLIDKAQGLILDSEEDLQMICESSCKMVSSVSIEGRVADLSILNYMEFADNKVHVGVFRNEELISFESMPSYEQMFAFRIEENTGLKSLKGLESLKHAPHLDIRYNTNLESIEGLSGLETAGTFENPGTGLSIYGNPKLKTLDGLNSLRETMMFQVSDNLELQSMTALESFEINHRDFEIENNPKLERLPQGKLKYASRRSADVQFNGSLAPCQVKGFFSALEEEPDEFNTSPNGVDSPEDCMGIAIE